MTNMNRLSSLRGFSPAQHFGQPSGSSTGGIFAPKSKQGRAANQGIRRRLVRRLIQADYVLVRIWFIALTANFFIPLILFLLGQNHHIALFVRSYGHFFKAFMLSIFASWTCAALLGAIGQAIWQRMFKTTLAAPEASDIGLLAEAIGSGTLHEHMMSKDYHAQLRQSLLQLLPRLQADEACLLSDKQRAYLHQILKSKDTQFLLAVLTALEQIGNSSSLPYVEKLAAGQWQAAKNDQIRQAAQHYLSILQARLQQQNNPQTLLRSTSAPNDTLLRAAEGTPTVEVDPQQMLRASQPKQPPAP